MLGQDAVDVWKLLWELLTLTKTLLYFDEYLPPAQSIYSTGSADEVTRSAVTDTQETRFFIPVVTIDQLGWLQRRDLLAKRGSD